MSALRLPTDHRNSVLAWRVEYDDQGRVSAKFDPAGQRTSFEYREEDGLVRHLAKTPPEGSGTRWDFDASGRSVQMTDRWGATSYTYDSKGRLRSVQRADCPAIVYDDDPANARTTISVGNHYRLELDYDFLGRLVKRTLQVLDPTTGRASTFPIRYEYRSSDGMVVRTLPNGIRTRWTYDPGGRLREILHIDAASLVLAEFTFDFGPKGRITSIHERSQRGKLLERFAYDHAGRLTQAARSDGRIYGYAYDALGNRLTATALTGKSQVADFDWAGR